MGQEFEVVVAGAGILGLASAYHILRQDPGLRLLVLERLSGPGLGSTGRSAAAYRDMFTEPVNRHLSQASISSYEKLQAAGVNLDLRQIGYLWLLTAPQASVYAPALESMARAGVRFDTLERPELGRRLPDLDLQDLAQGLLGRRCGILNPHRLARYYAQEVARLGGRLRYGADVAGFVLDEQDLIIGVRLKGEEILAGKAVLVATGAWMGQTLARAGLAIPVVPVKRQLFAIPAREGALHRLLTTPGFNAPGLLPFTILPGEAYLRPASQSFILGYADPGRAPGLEDQPRAERDFFERAIRPQVERYFPPFRGAAPSHAWAGFYEYHPPDNIAFVDRLRGALVVGGASGSGIMKADSLGRVAAGLFYGRDQVELADGSSLAVAAIALGRSLPPEEFVI